MERRDLFRILTAAVLAGPAAAQSTPRFFTAAEYATLERLCEILLPSAEQSPGAREARIAYFIDTVLHYGEPAERDRWRSGLAALAAAAQSRFGRPFLECSDWEQEQVVALMALNERRPSTELERFFGVFKSLAIEAYCLSEAGMRYLGYEGNTAVAEFPGCTHAEHQG